MVTRQSMTLRRKLILWFAGILAVMLVIFGTILYGVTRWALVRVVDNSLTDTVAQVIANSSAFPLGQFSTPDDVVVRLPELDVFRTSSLIVQAWRIVDGQLELAGATNNISSYPEALDPVMLRREAELIAADLDAPEMWSDTTINNGAFRVISRPVVIWGEDFVLQAALSMEQVNESSRWLLIIIAAGMAFGLIGSCLMGWSLAGRALDRIDVITQAAGRIAATDDLRTRMPHAGPDDEIGRLTQVFNHMMDRIEHMFGVQQRFVADVSHELRTPLTAIRGHLDLIKRYGADPESLDALESEVTRMSRLVTDLLMLAKADNGGLKPEMRPVDLDDLITEIYRDARVLAKDRSLKITVRDFEPVRVMADPDRIKQLLLNLVSNAIKFTPDGGTITINLRRLPCDALIEVCDTGIGISGEDQKHVFDRFFQSDTSRARHFGAENNEGVGLGLSICKWIADSHGALLSVHSELGIGTTFTLSMPHLEPESAPPDAVTRPRLSLMRRERTTEHAATATRQRMRP